MTRSGSNNSGRGHIPQHSSGSSPSTTTHNDETQSGNNSRQPDISIHADSLMSSGSSPPSLSELIPRIYWFEDTKVVRSVTSCIQQYYRQPHMNWTTTPLYVREQWFRIFKRSYTWEPGLEDLVRKDFTSVGARCLRNNVCKAARRKPAWMNKEVHVQLLEERKSKSFTTRSKRNKGNKIRGSEKNGDTIAPSHRQGSISTALLTRHMAKENNGVMPTAAEVFRRSHSKLEGSERVMCSKKAKKTMVDTGLDLWILCHG